MGTGDWNDGMNRVGEDGKGESVWLGWFLFDAIMCFIAHAERVAMPRGAKAGAIMPRRCPTRWNGTAWDGDWYRRAYFDDGTPLGSVSNGECRIDSIAQSWGVISGAADRTAPRAPWKRVDKYLVRAR